MIIGVYGYQDSGKTVLVEKLMKLLTARGLTVSSIKHTPHNKTVDAKGKDTWRHWQAGSDPVAFSSSSETSIIKHSPMPADDLASILAREFPTDVIIIEGFKAGNFPKVAIGEVPIRKGTVLKNPSVADLASFIEFEVAVERMKRQLPGLDCKKCGLDCEGLARATVAEKRSIYDCRELSSLDVVVKVDGERLATGAFVSDVVDKTVRGMLSSLRGYRAGSLVEIRLSDKRVGPKRRRKPSR